MSFPFSAIFAAMADIKVLQLSSERTWRGGEQQIAYLIMELRSHHVQVHVLARRGSAFAKWCHANEVLCEEVGFRHAFDLSTALAISAYAKSHHIDLVHAHSGKSHSLTYLASKLGMKAGVIVHRRVDFPLSSSRFKLAKYNDSKVKRIICVSEAIAQLVRNAIQRPDIVEVVYDGIAFDRFSLEAPTGELHRVLGIPPNRKLVVMIAALASHKDYETYIRCASSVVQQRDDVHFLAVGEGDLRPQLEALVKRLGIGLHFTFTGFREDISMVLREAHIFMLTSKTEGLGSSLIDALYNCLPVVATRAGGIPELFRDGKEGFLCNVADSEALASHVIKLLDDAELHGRMAMAAHRRALQFSAQIMASKVLAQYHAALTQE